MSTSNTPAATGQTTAVAKPAASIADSVLARVSSMQAANQIQLPPDYSAANALKSAHLILLETQDKNGKNALEVCTKESVANALLSMVVQGLNPDKKQAYFIPYNGKLQMQRSYMGTISLAKRIAGVKDVNAQVVMDGDEFDYHVDVITGKTIIAKHKPNLDAIDGGKIRGAYAIVIFENGERRAEYMTYAQIQRSWQQNRSNNGNSPAHQKFPEEMCKKTVINRALKLAINSSTDSALYQDGEEQEAPIVVQDTTFTEVKQEIAEKANSGPVMTFEEPVEQPKKTKAATVTEPEMETQDAPDF